jgi:hypothetical protein
MSTGFPDRSDPGDADEYHRLQIDLITLHTRRPHGITRRYGGTAGS